jgi:hypothetical protein
MEGAGGSRPFLFWPRRLALGEEFSGFDFASGEIRD